MRLITSRKQGGASISGLPRKFRRAVRGPASLHTRQVIAFDQSCTTSEKVPGEIFQFGLHR